MKLAQEEQPDMEKWDEVRGEIRKHLKSLDEKDRLSLVNSSASLITCIKSISLAWDAWFHETRVMNLYEHDDLKDALIAIRDILEKMIDTDAKIVDTKLVKIAQEFVDNYEEESAESNDVTPNSIYV